MPQNLHPAGDYPSTVLSGYYATNRFGRASIFLKCQTAHGQVEYVGELEGEYATKTTDALRFGGWDGRDVSEAAQQLTGKPLPLWVKHKPSKCGRYTNVQVYISTPRKGGKSQPIVPMTPQELAARLGGRTSPPPSSRSSLPVDSDDVPF